jgi:hypothetical protein
MRSAIREQRLDRDMQFNPDKVFAALFMLPAACWLVFNSLRTMEVRLNDGTVISRYERPVLFWFLVGIGFWGIFLSLWLVFTPNGPTNKGTDRSIRMEPSGHKAALSAPDRYGRDLPQ